MTTFDGDKAFAAALTDCGARIQRGEPASQCVADYPAAYRDALLRLLDVVPQLKDAGRDPSPQFRERLRARLLAGADDERARRRRGPSVFRHLWRAAPSWRAVAIGLVAVVVLSVSGLGAVQASRDSLPDSPLYGVKSAREWMQLSMARDVETQVKVRSSQVEERSREMELALRAGKLPRVVENLARQLSTTTERIVSQAIELKARGKYQPATVTVVLLRVVARRIEALQAQAPAAYRPALERLRGFLADQERRLTEAKPPAWPRTAGPLAPSPLPPAQVPVQPAPRGSATTAPPVPASGGNPAGFTIVGRSPELRPIPARPFGRPLSAP